MPYLSNTTVVGTLHIMHTDCCSYYKDQAHCSRYALAKGIELEGFIRNNEWTEMIYVVLQKYTQRKTKSKMKLP
jgi:hypothetical protein